MKSTGFICSAGGHTKQNAATHRLEQIYRALLGMHALGKHNGAGSPPSKARSDVEPLVASSNVSTIICKILFFIFSPLKYRTYLARSYGGMQAGRPVPERI